jgi:DNA-binding transcriptional regulator LsrR (DeoR family)
MAGPNAARQNIEDIRLGYELGLSQRELALQYHVGRSTIGRLLA